MMELNDGSIQSYLNYSEEVLGNVNHLIHIINGEVSSSGEMKCKLAFA